MELEVMRGLGSIPTGGNIFNGYFGFHIVKPLMPILALLPTLFNYEETRLHGSKVTQISLAKVRVQSMLPHVNCSKRNGDYILSLTRAQPESPKCFCFYTGCPEKTTSSSRLFTSCFWVLTITITATYSGNLIAFMAVKKLNVPLNSLKELAAHPEYQAGLPLGGSSHSLFKVKIFI